ncbi:tetratricopeptide repeat protein [Candidatus Margulisiibacteriota bacterium]
MNEISGNIKINISSEFSREIAVSEKEYSSVSHEKVSAKEKFVIQGLTDYTGREGLCINQYSWIRYVIGKYYGLPQTWNDEEYLSYFNKNIDRICEDIDFVRWGRGIDPGNPIHTFLYLELEISDPKLIEHAYIRIHEIFDDIRTDIDVFNATTSEEFLSTAWHSICKDFDILYEANENMLAVNLNQGQLDCDGYASLMYVIGFEFGWPLSLVEFPGHMIIRWEDSCYDFYFDQGNIISDEQFYIERFQLRNESIENIQFEEAIGFFYYLRGHYFSNTDLNEEALENYNYCELLYPNLFANLVNRAFLYLESGHIEIALAESERLLRLYPEFSDIYILRARIFFTLRDFEAVSINLEEAVRFTWEEDYLSFYNLGAAYLMLGEFDRSIDYLSRAIEINPDFSESYFALGNIYLNIYRDYDLALEHFNRAADLGREDPIIYLSRGAAYLGLGEYERALAYINRAEELGLQEYGLYMSRADVYFRLNNLELSLEDLLSALSVTVNFDSVCIWYSLGVVFYLLGDIREALICINRAYDLSVEDDRSIRRFRNMLIRSAAREGIDVNSCEIVDSYFFGNALIPDTVFADTVCTDTVCIRPGLVDNDLLMSFQRARLYLFFGDYEEARDENINLLSLDPESGPINGNLGISYYYLCDYRQAIEYFDRAEELGCVSWFNFYYKADAYFRLGEYWQALEAVSRAIQLNPNDEDTQALRRRIVQWIYQGRNGMGSHRR